MTAAGHRPVVQAPRALAAQPPQPHQHCTQLRLRCRLLQLTMQPIQEGQRALRLQEPAYLGPMSSAQQGHGRGDLRLRPARSFNWPSGRNTHNADRAWAQPASAASY